MHSTSREEQGFTLIELLVVVGMISILMLIAVPSFASFISNYRVTAAANDFLQGVSQTRAEALKAGRAMTMAPIVAGDWKSGWVIFRDIAGGQCPASPPNGQLDAGNAVEVQSMVFKHLALPTSTTVASATSASVAAFTDANSRTYISFDGTGYARQYCAGTLSGGIVFTDRIASSTNVRTLCMNVSGRPRVVKGVDTCASG